ncbi:3-ketoacyl-CoA thiolase 2, peroxisomal-like [Pyrus x bretschneideri]|uniref:3-ketoacyl-CoA thiolase 2, peroxisomal-like n=1 Tax=Pyrus x bretschneideri TaxID=225117 RepID=UPI00202F6222|nr:3-ketoacyl-CoA thiolase 2, peroxisomal-like [Pyrus x bretschneideri]
MNRQRVLLQHLRPNSSVSSSNYESAPLSASICAAGDSAAAYHRTAAFGDDAKRGAFKDTLPDDLLAPVLKVDIFAQARDCLLPMGITSENVAQRYGVESHRHAAVAQASGKFKDKIVPVSTKIVDPKTGEERPVTISVDDGIRPNTNMNDLAKLKPAFKRDGSTTADLLSLDFYKAFCLLHMTEMLAR